MPGGPSTAQGQADDIEAAPTILSYLSGSPTPVRAVVCVLSSTSLVTDPRELGRTRVIRGPASLRLAPSTAPGRWECCPGTGHGRRSCGQLRQRLCAAAADPARAAGVGVANAQVLRALPRRAQLVEYQR